MPTFPQFGTSLPSGGSVLPDDIVVVIRNGVAMAVSVTASADSLEIDTGPTGSEFLLSDGTQFLLPDGTPFLLS